MFVEQVLRLVVSRPSVGTVGVRRELWGGGCEWGSRSLEWGSRRANQRGHREAVGAGLRARLRLREGGEKEANHPLTSLSENDKLVGCH